MRTNVWICNYSKKKYFPPNCVSENVICSFGTRHGFFLLNVQILNPQNPKINIIFDSSFQEEDVSQEVVHLDMLNAVLKSFSQNFGRNQRLFVQREKTILRIKSFKKKTTLLSCCSVSVYYFFGNPSRIFPLKIRKKLRKWIFFKKNSLH